MYLQPTDQSVRETVQRLPEEGGFVMLNLFRLRETPDFSEHPELDDGSGASARQLLDRYIAEMDTFLNRYGIARIYLASGAACLIGPPGERWDVVQLVRYPSREAFISLSSDPELKSHVPLRAVSVEDSRVLPTFERDTGAVLG